MVATGSRPLSQHTPTPSTSHSAGTNKGASRSGACDPREAASHACRAGHTTAAPQICRPHCHAHLSLCTRSSYLLHRSQVLRKQARDRPQGCKPARRRTHRHRDAVISLTITHMPRRCSPLCAAEGGHEQIARTSQRHRPLQRPLGPGGRLYAAFDAQGGNRNGERACARLDPKGAHAPHPTAPPAPTHLSHPTHAH